MHQFQQGFGCQFGHMSLRVGLVHHGFFHQPYAQIGKGFGSTEAARGAGVPVPLTAASAEVHRWLRSRGLDAADSAALVAYYDAKVGDPSYWLG